MTYDEKLGEYALTVRAKPCANGETIEWELVAKRALDGAGEGTISSAAKAAAASGEGIGLMSKVFGVDTEAIGTAHEHVLATSFSSEASPVEAMRSLLARAGRPGY